MSIKIISPSPERSREIVPQNFRFPRLVQWEMLAGTRSEFWHRAAKVVRGARRRDSVLIVGLEFEELIEAQLQFVKSVADTGSPVYLRIATTGDFNEVIRGRSDRLRKLSLCQGLIVLTDTMEDELSTNTFGIPRVHVIPNMVDPDRYGPITEAERRKARQIHGIDQNAVVFLWTGRFDERKRLGDLVCAWVNAHIDGVLVLVGSDCYQNKACLHNIESHITGESRAKITFLNPVPESEMPQIYALGDIFVTTSNREGLSNSVLEAVTRGLPVVGFDISGVREILEEDQKNRHWLVKAGNINAYTRALQDAYRKRREICPLSLSTKPDFSENIFNPKRITRQYMDTLFGAF